MKESHKNLTRLNKRFCPLNNRKIFSNKIAFKPFLGDVYSTCRFNPFLKYESTKSIIAGNFLEAFDLAHNESNFISLGDLHSHTNISSFEYYNKALKSECNIVKSVAYQRLSSLCINDIIINNDKTLDTFNDAIRNADSAIKCYRFNLLAYMNYATLSFISRDYNTVLKYAKLFKYLNKWDKLNRLKFNEYTRSNQRNIINKSRPVNVNLHAEILLLEAKSFLALKNSVKALGLSIKLYKLLSLATLNHSLIINNFNHKSETFHFDDNKYINNDTINIVNDYRLLYLKIESLIIASCAIYDIEHEIFSKIKLIQSINLNEIKKMNRNQVEFLTRSFIDEHQQTKEQCSTEWTSEFTNKYIDYIISELKKVDPEHELKAHSQAWASALLYASGRRIEAGRDAIYALLLDIYSSASKKRLFDSEEKGINAVDIVALVFKQIDHPNWKVFSLLSKLLDESHNNKF